MHIVNGWSRDERNDYNKQYMSPCGMVYRLPELPIKTQIYYPLSVKVNVTIHPYTFERINSKCNKCKSEKNPNKYMDVSYFLWRIAQEYKYIYKNHEQFGIWGHCLGDLVFEGVKFNKNGIAEIYIGS